MKEENNLITLTYLSIELNTDKLFWLNEKVVCKVTDKNYIIQSDNPDNEYCGYTRHLRKDLINVIDTTLRNEIKGAEYDSLQFYTFCFSSDRLKMAQELQDKMQEKIKSIFENATKLRTTFEDNAIFAPA